LDMSWHMNIASLDKASLNRASNLRDRQMADNLIWLTKRAYPTRKIVVWSANSHIMRQRFRFEDQNSPFIPMGEWIDKAMGPDVYVLGFTAYQGRWGEVGMSEPLEVVPPAPNSLEELLFASGFEYAWLDFRNGAADGAWLREPRSCRPLKYAPAIADWTRMMDGLFFIKEMFPSTRNGGRN
jgi:erythromycin esterase